MSSKKAQNDGGLSAREREVLELVAQGLPDKEIAARLFISISTVRFHLKHIIQKLRVCSRMEAALKHNATGSNK